MRADRRSAIWREGLRLGDQGVVSFVIHARVNKSTVHAPSTVTCGNTVLLDPCMPTASICSAPQTLKNHQGIMLLETYDFSSLQLCRDLPVFIHTERHSPPPTFPERTNRSSHRSMNIQEPYYSGEKGGMDAHAPLSKCSNKPVSSSSLINDKHLKLGALPFIENNEYKLTAKKASQCLQNKQLSGEA